jgi:16S rRNA (cytosine967-C5)-methyltransferase
MDTNRKTAYNTLVRMEKDSAYSNIELNVQIKRHNPDSPGFVRELVYGVLENKLYLDYLLEQLITRGTKGLKPPVITILRMGLYQLIFMDSVPEYAAVDESVKLARRMCFGQVGLINAVLRNYLRKKDKLKEPDDETDPVKRLKYQYSYDPWIVDLWNQQYGHERAAEIMESCNQKPPMFIRVNHLKISTSTLAEKLKERGLEVQEYDKSERVLIVKGRDVIELPEYEEGLFSVQDAASVLAMEALAPKKDDVIVDVCAAPGGKSLACAEMMGNVGRIIAFDLYDNKLKHLRKDAERLDATIVETAVFDAMKVNKDLVGIADRVICDVPCTGLGVIRRKPEIKFKVVSNSGRDLAKKQLAILEASANYLKGGGFLMYSTCTINSIENKDVIGKFLKKHQNFDLIRSRQLLPTSDGTDGFYYCKMKKKY